MANIFFRLETWRSRQREEQDDFEFPDEVDTPKDVPARTRFQRYRGLRSFRTSPWDPFENLPRDYARIFQFEDFKRTERGVRRRAEEEGAGVSVRILHMSPCPDTNSVAAFSRGQGSLCISKMCPKKPQIMIFYSLLLRSVSCNTSTKSLFSTSLSKETQSTKARFARKCVPSYLMMAEVDGVHRIL